MGATATGKTRLAVGLARTLGAAVASVDSRQVYRGLDLCSGKDLQEYGEGGQALPVFGLDLLELDGEFSLFQFAQKAMEWSRLAEQTGRPLVWCGGSSLYLDALLKGYQLQEAPPRPEWRREVEGLGMEELALRLRHVNPRLHNTTDLENRDRLLRALEIALAVDGATDAGMSSPGEEPGMKALLLVLDLPHDALRERIRLRLHQRLKAGLLDEVAQLLDGGVPPERLHRLGLEARWALRQLRGEVAPEAMAEGLAQDIWKFARAQLSWLRRFQRRGLPLHHLDGLGDPLAEAMALVERHGRELSHDA